MSLDSMTLPISEGPHMSGTSAAHALDRQDRFRAHRSDHVSVQMRRNLAVDLPPNFLLEHSPGVLDPHPRHLRGESRR